MIPFSSTGGFIPENMIAICPNHSLKFLRHELTSTQLSDSKVNPHNRVKANNSFAISSEELTVNMGKSRFIDTCRVLSVDDFDLITIKKENNLSLVLDIKFFDIQNNLIAVVSENSWTTDKSQVWNIDYKPHHLKIHNLPKRISFEAKIESDEIYISAEMYYNGVAVKVTKEQILVGGIDEGVEIKGTTLKNYHTAINLQTNK